MRDAGGGRKPRKKSAYPKVGSGEDFPARRPGTKVGEDRRGRQIKQRTNASMSRGRRSTPFSAKKIPLGRDTGAQSLEPWMHGKPTGRRQWPFSAGVRGKATRRDPWPL